MFYFLLSNCHLYLFLGVFLALLLYFIITLSHINQSLYHCL